MVVVFFVWAVLAGCTDKEPGTGDTDGGTSVIDADGDGFPEAVDCDDSDPAAFPGAEEIWYDGVDQDCDGSDDDQDEDGHPLADDCDDTDPTVFPGAGEVPDDGVDQDCNGVDAVGGGVDADGDGYPAAVDCDDDDPAVHPGAADAAGDGIDQDCSGADALPEADADGDGWASEAYGGPDCDDGDASIRPDAVESVGDDVDSDCDGADYGVSGLAVGELVITELMYDPDAVGDGDGEWFEVLSGAAHTVNLRGLLVADDPGFAAADRFAVDADLVAAPGDRLVFAVAGDPKRNGGIVADYDFAGAGVNLNNAGDDLHLGVDAGGSVTTLDTVAYDELAGWPVAKGASIELKDARATATSNDSASNWCLATTPAGTTTDRGSPGAESSGC